MKKSGFTLIELLAVIVILAIIALIAVPIILNVIEKAREGSAIDSGYNYINAVENAMALNMLDMSKPDIKDGVYSVSELNTTYGVQVKGNAPKEGSVTIENGKVKECTLQIDNYELTCNGNELILGKSTLPEHRMMDSFIDFDMDDVFNDQLMQQVLEEMGITIREFNSSSQEQMDQYTSTYMRLVSNEMNKMKKQATYFLPDTMVPESLKNWDGMSNLEDIHAELKKIEKVLTVKTNDVPSNAIGSKDISANQDGSVIVWYLDQDNDDKLEMYIGQDGGVIAPSNCNSLFGYFSDIILEEAIMDLSNFDTSKVTNMNSMFDGLDLVTLDLSNFDTSKVTDMSEMFARCHNLTNLNISSFNTSKVIDMSGMFMFDKISNLDLSSFDTRNVTDMSEMFAYSSLNNLNISNFNTSKVTDMSEMFYSSSNLTTLDLRSFDTSNVTDMSKMFYSSENLTTLDLSSFNTSKVTDMSEMFYRSSNLTTIYKGSNWVINSGTNTNYMFYDCGTDTLTLKP